MTRPRRFQNAGFEASSKAHLNKVARTYKAFNKNSPKIFELGDMRKTM